MKNSTLIIIVFAVIFLGSGIFFFNSQKAPSSDTAMQPDQVTMQEDPSTTSGQENSQMPGGNR
ncbi:MAG TPA: hypothetical protein VLF20_05015, partial [Patescibacteria group bacterium]|nr:hypothetical protein [Patescibacteria group bacterium]